jgi:hypothetical protein
MAGGNLEMASYKRGICTRGGERVSLFAHANAPRFSKLPVLGPTTGHRETWNSTRASGEHTHQVHRHSAWCFLLKITERQCEEIGDSKAAKITLVERGQG